MVCLFANVMVERASANDSHEIFKAIYGEAVVRKLYKTDPFHTHNMKKEMKKLPLFAFSSFLFCSF